MLDWRITDLNGITLEDGRLTDRKPGGKVEIAQHDIRKASVPLNIEDPSARLAYPLFTLLKVAMDDWPLFTGLMMKPRFDVQARTVELNAVGVEYRFQYLFTGMRSDGAGLANADAGTSWRVTASRLGSLPFYLIQHVKPTAAELAAGVVDHGVNPVWTALGPIVNRDFNPGSQIWTSLTDMTTVDDPIEWEFTPLDEQNGYHAQFNIWHPRQGSDKSTSIIFHAGWGRHSAVNLVYEPDGGPVINRSMQVGQAIEGEPQKFARADQPESQLAFGQFMQYEGRPDVLDPTVLAEYAQGAVSTQGWPQDFFTITIPTDDGSGYVRDAFQGTWTKLPRKFGKPFRFGPGPDHDFWIGDTIGAIAKAPGGFNESLTGRVHSGTVTEVDSVGNIQTEVSATPTVDETGVTVVTG